MNDINSLVTRASLRLYMLPLMSQSNARLAFELSINTGVKELDRCFSDNYFTVNAGKTQAMVMGKTDYDYELKVSDTSILIATALKILEVTPDKRFTY